MNSFQKNCLLKKLVSIIVFTHTSKIYIPRLSEFNDSLIHCTIKHIILHCALNELGSHLLFQWFDITAYSIEQFCIVTFNYLLNAIGSHINASPAIPTPTTTAFFISLFLLLTWKKNCQHEAKCRQLHNIPKYSCCFSRFPRRY